MARITPQIIEELKTQSDIVTIIDQYVPLRQKGSNWAGVCPFHEDHSPSMIVTPSMGIYKCFACGAGGDVFKFLQEHEKIDFPAAVEIVAKECGYILPEDKPETPQQKAQRAKFSIVADANEMATKWFQNQLQRSESTMKYLIERGVESKTIETLKIGWAPDSWDALIGESNRQGISRKDLIEAGLVKENDKGKSYDAFRGRLIFPIQGLSNKVIAFGGRTLINDPAKYYNSPETALYSKSNVLYGLNHARKSIATTQEVIFVEGYFDFLQLFQHGIQNVVSVSGTALTTGHAQILKRYAKKAYLVFDGDEAGQKAARRSISILLPHGIETKILLLPDGEDPDSLVRDHGANEFRQRIQQGLDIIDFTLEDNNYQNASPEEKFELVNKIKELVALIPNQIVRNEYIRKAASRLGIEEQLIHKAHAPSNNYNNRQNSPSNYQKNNSSQNSYHQNNSHQHIPAQFNSIELRMITLVLKNKDLHVTALNTLDTELFIQNQLAEIIDYAMALLEERGTLELPLLYDRLPKNLRHIFISLADEEWSEENALIEYTDTLLQMKIKSIENQRKALKNTEELSYEAMVKLTKYTQQIKELTAKKRSLASKKSTPEEILEEFL